MISAVAPHLSLDFIRRQEILAWRCSALAGIRTS